MIERDSLSKLIAVNTLNFNWTSTSTGLEFILNLESVMPYHRRNKKRHRNKSSPQVVSSPKKHRHSEVIETTECEKIAELTNPTDSESVAGDSEMSSVMESGDNINTGAYFRCSNS